MKNTRAKLILRTLTEITAIAVFIFLFFEPQTSNSIITLENRKRRNIKNECLLCDNCVDICPKSICVLKF